MKYRTLGKTGLSVSILGFGASSLGSEFRRIDEKEGIRTVHLAIDSGVNLIDVSPYYGRTTAEALLGKALRDVPRDRYYLATKVGRYDVDQFDFSAERVSRSVEESLQRLGVDHIDIIQCHDIEFGDLDQIVSETLPALRALRAAGKVRFIGITGLPLRIFEEVVRQTEVDTILSYCRYVLNDTSLARLIPMLTDRGVGIMNASPLSMRLLTRTGPPQWHPAPDAVRQACSAAAEACEARGVDIAQVAMRFAVSHPSIHTTIVGTASPENMGKNLAWIEQAIDPDLLGLVKTLLEPVQNVSWPSGRPENNDTI